MGYKEAFFDEGSESLCIVMEYCDAGDLYKRIVQHKKSKTYFSEEEVWSLFISMLKGLHTLHQMKIMHRDLKSANCFLMKNNTIKLGDLNVSKIVKRGLSYT